PSQVGNMSQASHNLFPLIIIIVLFVSFLLSSHYNERQGASFRARSLIS
ncbi:3170_t:CDS:1, partial [Scutellospora calospora]